MPDPFPFGDFPNAGSRPSTRRPDTVEPVTSRPGPAAAGPVPGRRVGRTNGGGRGKRVYLSLGSNLGDRAANLSRALRLLDEARIEVRRVSSLYRTEPVDFRPQPWFVNCVVEVWTELMPLRLLRTLQSIERALGRRHGPAKGPRQIDIDILLYENVVLRSSTLTIPHPRLAERRFVLIPLRELAGTTRHPVSRRTVLEMLNDTADTSQVLKLKGSTISNGAE